MDVSSLKSSLLDPSKAKDPKAKGLASTVVTVASLAQSFTEMVKAGLSIDRGAGQITKLLGSAKSDPADRPAPTRPVSVDRRDDAYGRYDERRDAPVRNEPRTDAARDDNPAADNRDRAAEGSDVNRNSNASGRDEAASGPDNDRNAGQDNAPDNGSEQKASDSGNEQDSGKNSGDDSTDAAAKNAAATGDTKTAQSNATAVKSNSEKVLVDQIVLARNSSLPGQSSEQATAKTAETGGRENAAEGLAKALAAASKQNQSKTGSDDKASSSRPGQTKANAQSNANVQPTAQAATGPAVKAQDVTAQQAAGIAKAVGEGNKVSVQVEVKDEAAVLISKPRSNLLATAQSGDGNKSASGQNSGQNNGQNGGQSQNALAQAQSQTASQAQNALQQAAQVQTASGPNANASAKGALNAPASGGPGGPGGAGGIGGIGGESLPGAGAGALDQANHGRQTAEAKSAAQQAGLPPKAVINQVTVQITKAISAGVDKINIQLRPETLGRVDVLLEMTKDGKTVVIVTADNKNTLDLLKQDSQSLEQALRDAGLDLGSDDLDFNLRGEEAGGEEGHGGPDNGHGMAESEDEGDGGNEPPYAGLYSPIIEEDRIDVRA